MVFYLLLYVEAVVLTVDDDDHPYSPQKKKKKKKKKMMMKKSSISEPEYCDFSCCTYGCVILPNELNADPESFFCGVKIIVAPTHPKHHLLYCQC
jgi:hypothetical protein